VKIYLRYIEMGFCFFSDGDTPYQTKLLEQKLAEVTAKL
jgi:hypothetical protein